MTPSPPHTPRPKPSLQEQSDKPVDDSTTPTRATFSPVVAGQKPLPTSPFPDVPATEGSDESNRDKREGSHHSATSPRKDGEDIDMDDSDGDPDGSDDESVNADGTRSSKKKKTQRFYCTDYPPCHLSFTRSEHLARHIRKHTGERPFQCHCNRRFSRLDNLRQHAQTVHVNEDIPMDSLAATGSRFQRQIRTERVRQAGNRARASTGGSAGGPMRGHSKSLSASSINSVSSVGSAYSVHNDARRRPPPLVMAADPRSRVSMDGYRGPEATYFRPQSPSEFSTPTSATFSTGQGSPRWPSGMASPANSHSRSQSMYSSGPRTPGRRLSVPSGQNPFQSPHGSSMGRVMFGPGQINTSNSGAFSPADSSLLSSPTASTSGWSARRDSTSSAADEAWRRRTWHPDSRGYSTYPSQLSTVVSQTAMQPNPPPPIAEPTSAQSSTKLPGIDSLYAGLRRPMTPPYRQSSPMAIDSEPPLRQAPRLPGLEASPIEDRRNANIYDPSLHRGITRLDINPHTPPRDSAGAWASEVNRAVQDQAEQVRLNPPSVRFQEPIPTGYHNHGPSNPGRAMHQQTMSAPSIASARDNRRHGWYHGPMTAHRGEGEYTHQEPRAAHVDRMVHPNVSAFGGFPGRESQPTQQHEQQQQQQQQEPSGHGDSLRRLEALVAVATSENSTATAC